MPIMIQGNIPKEDTFAQKSFVDEGMWGIEALINLYGCNKSMIGDPKYIKQFIIDLCDHIKMKRFGAPIIEKFGEGGLYGISFVQLIYTSSIVGHCSEDTGDVYIDVFSCKEFPPKEVAEFCKKYFEAKEEVHSTVLRE